MATHLERTVPVGVIEVALLLAATGSTTRGIIRRMSETRASIIETMMMRGIIETMMIRGIIETVMMRGIIETARRRSLKKRIKKRMRWKDRGWTKMGKKARGSDVRRSVIMTKRIVDPRTKRSGKIMIGLRMIGSHLMEQIPQPHLILRPLKLKSLAIFRKSRRRTLILTNPYLKRKNRRLNWLSPLLTSGK